MLYFGGTVYLGDQTVTSTTGKPFSNGEFYSLSHMDFRKDQKDVQDDVVELWGISGGSVTVHVTTVRR